MTTRHVYLGRFAPFHKGHGLLLGEIVRRVGVDKVLVILGSTNTINPRTPYTFEDRREIIKISFPEIEVIPLPDGKPNLEYFDGSTNDVWLDSIEAIAKSRGEKFVFYGGSKDDLEVLAQRFETKIIVSREILPVSATQVRGLIDKGDLKKLAELVDTKALDMIINKRKRFL